jgi:long-chain acyl-CoA synthetase
MVETQQKAAADTFPRLLLQHAQSRPQQPSFREKDLGIWQTTSWSQVAVEVRALAAMPGRRAGAAVPGRAGG